ncbi:hypothetical protein FB45DRAFT_938977 [Roridomyces roridus]|uniref:Uncharacterized protein n=1 Tax=Roridomyces roridus TaxID=1738132 RepID=A0AAD7FD48_9AGAR|nr:hypothetical protein FB45DRAFT_938977 [Roridomyces roridus]
MSSATYSPATSTRMCTLNGAAALPVFAGKMPTADVATKTTVMSSAALDAKLLSVRLHSLHHARQEPVSTLLVEDEEDPSDTESDTDSEHSSAFTSYSTESLTSAGSSPPSSPAAKSAPLALATAPSLLYRAPRRRTIPSSVFKLSAALAHLPRKPNFPPVAKTTSTTYLYQGGVTRVMTGGVMLGSL